MKSVFKLLAISGLALFSHQGCAQANPPAANAGKPASDASQAPAVLPGNGLAQHDFFYAGEAKEERMSIVRGGQVVWSYMHPGRGEISDAVLEPNGNILFAHQFGITEIRSERGADVDCSRRPGRLVLHASRPWRDQRRGVGAEREHSFRPPVWHHRNHAG